MDDPEAWGDSLPRETIDALRQETHRRLPRFRRVREALHGWVCLHEQQIAPDWQTGGLMLVCAKCGKEWR